MLAEKKSATKNTADEEKRNTSDHASVDEAIGATGASTPFKPR